MITMKDIIKDGHPTLRKVAEEVPLPPSEEDRRILASLLEYVKMSQDPELAKTYGLRPGIGLAAPQINVSKRMIAVHVTDEKGTLHSYALFNPKIVSHSVENVLFNERRRMFIRRRADPRLRSALYAHYRHRDDA
ncbi:Peptide deformylase 2 [Anoxybacillus sp. BCO1]|nr:Peptide deformylase 2 [Anoxybacillus sp. BCO1]